MKPRKHAQMFFPSAFENKESDNSCSLFSSMTEDKRKKKIALISEFCMKLCGYWISHPELRFGQIVFNLFMTGVRSGLDIFYMEDEEALDLLNAEYEN